MRLELLLQGGVALLRPLSERHEVLPEALDRIAQGPRLPLVPGAIARRVVAS